MSDILNQDSTIVDNSSSSNLDELIRNYTMGKPTEADQVSNKEAFAPVAPAQGKGAALLFNTAGNIAEGQNKKAKQAEIKQKEMEQRTLEEKIGQGILDEGKSILDQAVLDNNYDDAMVKLMSLQMKASKAGIPQLVDTIENIAQKGVGMLAKEQNKRTVFESKQNQASEPVADAEKELNDFAKLIGYPGQVKLPTTPDGKRSWKDDRKSTMAELKLWEAMNSSKTDKTQKDLYARIDKMKKATGAILTRVSNAKAMVKEYKGKKFSAPVATALIDELVTAGMPLEQAKSIVVDDVSPSWLDMVKDLNINTPSHPKFSDAELFPLGDTDLKTKSALNTNAWNTYEYLMQYGKLPDTTQAPALGNVEVKPLVVAKPEAKSKYVKGKVYTNAKGEKATWDGTKFVK